MALTPRETASEMASVVRTRMPYFSGLSTTTIFASAFFSTV